MWLHQPKMRCEIRKERIPFVKQLIRFMNKAPSNKPVVHTDDRRYLSFFAFSSSVELVSDTDSCNLWWKGADANRTFFAWCIYILKWFRLNLISV
jgi:hypothetical protein